MSCILRICGKELNIDSLLERLTFEPYQIYRKGEPRFPSASRDMPLETSSGMHVIVSNAEIQDFDLQVQDAIEFLSSHSKSLDMVTNYPGIEYATLDFSIEWQNTAVQTDFLPSELLRLVGRLGLSIDLSHYPLSDES